MTTTPNPNPIGPPSRDAIAEAYQEGGCDICFGPPDVGADRVVGGCDFADHDPEDLHWLAGWNVAFFAGCSRCQFSQHARPRD